MVDFINFDKGNSDWQNHFSMKFYKKVILSIIFNSLVFWFLSENFNEMISSFLGFGGTFEIIGSWESFVFLAILFCLLNWFIKPLINLITIPIRFITIGLFTFVINAFMLYALELGVNFLQFFDTQLVIVGWGTYIIVGLILSAANAVIHWFED